MKALLAAILTLLVAAPAFAGDCILDNCADRQPLPSAQASPADGFGRGVSRGGGASGDFDFYVLSLSWSPSFCETTGARRPSAPMRAGRQSRLRRSRPVAAERPGLSQPVPRRILPFPMRSCRRLGDLYPDVGLARHEWRQHGLCSGKSSGGLFRRCPRRARFHRRPAGAQGAPGRPDGWRRSTFSAPSWRPIRACAPA